MLSNIFYLYNFTSTIKNKQDGKYYRDQHTAVLDQWYLEIFDRSHCTMLAFDLDQIVCGSKVETRIHLQRILVLHNT